MSARTELAMREADARYLRERVALLKSKLYRGELGSPARLETLERSLERAEWSVREQRERGSR